MTAMTPDWLNALALLDEALAQTPADLEPWLADAAARHPGAEPLLRKLLSAHGRVESHDILATLPKLRRSERMPDAGAVGLRVGPYELIEPLGRGGMGSVWRARYADGRLKREVAIKLPAVTADPQTLATLRERFARERDFLAQLEHPNIARLYDAGVSEAGQPYLAMEFVAGMPIAEHCDTRHLGVRSRLELFLQVLDAVGHAHQQLVLHRDLKAGNVLVDEQGQVRLLDFGVARLLPPGEGDAGAGADAASDLTERAGAAYTLGHAAPEQVTHGALSTATDVYALGVMLYHLLTGLSPYQPLRDTRGALEDAVLLATPAAASSREYGAEALAARQSSAPALRKALRGDIDVILGRALKKNPAERYATVAALADDLRRHLARLPISARADGWSYRWQLFVSRNRWPVAAYSLAALALVETAGTAVWQANVSARNAALAQKEAARANSVQAFFARLLSKADPEKNKNITAVDRQVMDGALEDAETQFADPETLVAVLRQLSDIYLNLGNQSLHLRVQKKLVEALKALPGVTADELADANISLGYALWYSDSPEDRAQALPKSLAAYETAVGTHASKALQVRSLCSIADLYRSKAQYVLAHRYALLAVALAEQALPRPHSELARAYDQRGTTATDLGEFELARRSFQEAMKVGDMQPARGRAAQLNSQKNLANAEFDAGNYLAARQVAQAALDYAYRNLGETEANLTALRVRVVLASERAGELGEAKRLADTIFVGDLQSGDPFRVGRARYAQGIVALARGELRQAAQAFQDAEPGLANDLRWRWRAQAQQVAVKLRLGQPQAAQAALAPLLAGIRADLGTQNEQFSRAAELSGVAWARLQRPEKARDSFNEACAWPRAMRSVEHPNRVRCEAYTGLSTDSLSRDDRRLVLDSQLAMLLRDRRDTPALAATIRRAQEWLSKPGNNALPLQNFPLLD